MQVLSEAEIRSAVALPEAVAAVEAGFAALSKGHVQLPLSIYLELPQAEGEAHVKGAYIRGAPWYFFKVASGFYKNPTRGLPTSSGMFLAFDAMTGVPVALLLDNGFLTDLRTAAAGAVAAKYLARARLNKVAVIGSGSQARWQLRALAVVREVPRVEIWSRSVANARICATEMQAELGVPITVAPDVESAVRDADLIVTVTPSREPLLRSKWIAHGAHVTAVGSDGPDKQELASDVLADADLLIVDSLEQCLKLGEIHHGVDQGVIHLEDVAGELGDVVTRRVPARTRDEQITVCDLTGVGVQDAAIGSLALEGVTRLGLGTSLLMDGVLGPP